MWGTDISEEQLAAAEQFIMLLKVGDKTAPARDQLIVQRFGDVVRLVALYGALRAKAVEKGNSADIPGEIFLTSSEGNHVEREGGLSKAVSISNMSQPGGGSRAVLQREVSHRRLEGAAREG